MQFKTNKNMMMGKPVGDFALEGPMAISAFDQTGKLNCGVGNANLIILKAIGDDMVFLT